MANKRMFSLSVTDTDEFLDLPVSSQALYFHLGMHGDDDGFVGSPRKIMRAASCGADDLKVLVAKGFIIPFESGVVVIRDWQLNNTLKNDRYHATVYQKEKALLRQEDTGRYALTADPSRNENGSILEPEHNSTELNSTEPNGSVATRRKRFTPPTVEDVRGYCRERKNNVDAQRFVDFYSAKGWKIGQNKMSDWHAAVRTWERKSNAEDIRTPRNYFEEVENSL